MVYVDTAGLDGDADGARELARLLRAGRRRGDDDGGRVRGRVGGGARAPRGGSSAALAPDAVRGDEGGRGRRARHGVRAGSPTWACRSHWLGTGTRVPDDLTVGGRRSGGGVADGSVNGRRTNVDQAQEVVAERVTER